MATHFQDMVFVRGKRYARRNFRSRTLLHSFWNELELELFPCFVFEVKKMRAEISVPEHCYKAAATVRSSSYDLAYVWGKEDAPLRGPSASPSTMVARFLEWFSHLLRLYLRQCNFIGIENEFCWILKPFGEVKMNISLKRGRKIKLW